MPHAATGTAQGRPPPPALAHPKPTSKLFWALMDRWGVDDGRAAALIDAPAVQTASGKRRRFALSSEQASRLHYLLEIDLALEAMPGGPGPWIRHRNTAHVFNDAAPLDFMIDQGRPGFVAVLSFLARWGLGRSAR